MIRYGEICLEELDAPKCMRHTANVIGDMVSRRIRRRAVTVV